eukprot:s731_g18.t1
MSSVDDCDTKSVASTTSKTSKASKYSVRSFMSKASSVSASVKRGLSSFAPSMRKTTASVAAMVDLGPGDVCETASLVTIRKEESLDSDLVCEVAPGQTLDVIEVGQGRRIKVRNAQGVEGWISSKTKLNEPLVIKRKKEMEHAMEGWETKVQHEVKSMVTVRTGEALDSDYIGELKPGAIITIKELGIQNKRRALVDSGVVVGWISLVTKTGEHLVGKVTGGSSSKEKQTMWGSNKVKDMLEACRCGDLDLLKKMIEPGTGIMSKFSQRPNLNASDIRGKTALIYASSYGHREVVDYLLNKSKDIEVNAVDDTDKTALHHAARRNSDDEEQQADIITMLLHAKAYIEARDHNGCTALMFAVANGNEAITRRLILAQANVNNFDYENHSCLNYALQFNQTKLVGLLKKAGAMDKLSLDDEDDEEDDGAGSMSPSASPSRLQLPRGLPDSETASCAESLSTEAPETSPLSAATGGADSPEVKKKKKKVKEADGDASPDGAVKKKKKAATADGEKAEKGTKKKKVKSQGLGEKGLMEAVAVQDEGAITVKEEPEKKEEVPVEDGPTDEELAKAAAMKKEKEAAREALKEAVAKPEMSRLELAIEKAKKAELEAKEIAAAEKALSVEKVKQDARNKLRDAEDSGNVDKLKAAMEEAMTAGLDASELKHVKDLLDAAESKEKVEAALRAAVQERNVHDLKFAIPQAKESGIDAKLISEAEEVLRLEEPKMKAREQLQEAATHVSKAALQAAIQAAKDAGLEPKEYAKAEALLKKEEQKEKLMKEVNAALADSQQVDMKSIDALREMKDKLQTALKAALEAGVPEADLVPIDQRRKKLHNAVEVQRVQRLEICVAWFRREIAGAMKCCTGQPVETPLARYARGLRKDSTGSGQTSQRSTSGEIVAEFPMYTIQADLLLEMTAIQPHEELLAAGAWDSAGHGAGFGKLTIFDKDLGRAAFVSHQWIGQGHPDPEFKQMKVLQDTLRNLFSGASEVSVDLITEAVYFRSKGIPSEQWRGKRLFLWYDYFSCPQLEDKQHLSLQKAIDSIPAYVSRCDFFMALCPVLGSPDSSEAFSDYTWGDRGWCRVEQLVDTDRARVAVVLRRILKKKLFFCLETGDFVHYRFLLNQQSTFLRNLPVEAVEDLIPSDEDIHKDRARPWKNLQARAR